MRYSHRFIIVSLSMTIFMLWSCGERENESTSARVDPVNSGFYSLEEFLDENEEQRVLYADFVKLVQNPAIPVDPERMRSPVKIAMIYPGSERSDYWERSVSSFSARMDELNIPYEILEYFSRPGNVDKIIQEQQIKEALQAKPDFLVFTLDIQHHRELIESIITLGRPKIILQNITTPLREWRGNQPFLYVGFSHREGSVKVLAPEFLKRVGNSGTYGMLYFSKGVVSEQRGDSIIRYLKDNSTLELVAAYYTDGQFEKARSATEQLLDEYPGLDFIYACSTSIALAAVEVLEERGMKNSVFVNGWGGGSAELESIEQGKLDFTVMRINDDNGVAMAEAIKLDLMDMRNLVPTVYSGDFALVSQETGMKELQDLKHRAFRYSGTDE